MDEKTIRMNVTSAKVSAQPCVLMVEGEVLGTYIIKVGASSADIRLQQEVVLSGSSVTKPLRDHYFSESIVSQ